MFFIANNAKMTKIINKETREEYDFICQSFMNGKHHITIKPKVGSGFIRLEYRDFEEKYEILEENEGN